MGMRQSTPGIYQGDPEYVGEDLERHEALVRCSRMPAVTRNTKRLHNFEVVPGREEGWQASLDFIEGKIQPPLMLLYGEPGRSKTHLALAVGWRFLGLLKPVLYYEVTDLLDALREGYDIDEHTQPGEIRIDGFRNLTDRLKRYELLILDDMGVEKKSDWTAERLDFIVNNRLVNGKPTLITANTLAIPPRILDRCKEGLMVRLQGESYREIIRKRKAAGEARK